MYRASLYLTFTMMASPLAGQTPAPGANAGESITPADVAHHINVIADDSMMGRDTPSRGLELTAQYVADQFKRLGLQPGGDTGTWLQRYPVPLGSGTAPNTVGILEGSDPKLKDEYVIISAHMDHRGVRSGSKRGEGGDSIYNGASNNGSGTAGVIELAEAFSQGVRPRRSVIFLAVSGNEKGLWGSRHFLQHFGKPVKQVVANLNLDGIGRNRGDTLLVLGRPYTDLGAALDRTNTAHPELHLTVAGNSDIDERFFKFSDQYTFARGGVPSLCFTGALNRDVDRVSDSPDKIDAERETRILRLVFHLGQAVANEEQRPVWKKLQP